MAPFTCVLSRAFLWHWWTKEAARPIENVYRPKVEPVSGLWLVFPLSRRRIESKLRIEKSH